MSDAAPPILSRARRHTAVERWILGLSLPWDQLPRRWAMTLAIGALMQHASDDAGVALREWWPATCRPETLAVWGQILGRPQHDGETAEAYRRRLTLWRDEAVGTSKWVRDEVARITGAAVPPVLEFPLDAPRWGHGRWGGGHWGVGPKLVVGVDPADRADVEAKLDEGVPPHVGVTYLAPDVFDAVMHGPDGPPPTPVPPVSGPPTANAGADAWGVWGNTIALSGSAVPGAGRSIAARQWTQTAGATVALTGANTDAPSFTAPNTDDTLTFRYTVIDDAGDSATDDVTVEIGVQAGQFAAPTGRRLVFDASLVRGSSTVDTLSLFRLPENNQGGNTNLTIGRLRDGSLRVTNGAATADITRVFFTDDLGLQDHPHAEDVGAAIGADAELHVTTAGGTTMTMTVTTDDEDAFGPQFYRWNLTASQRTTIGAIVVGRSFAVAVSVPE